MLEIDLSNPFLDKTNFKAKSSTRHSTFEKNIPLQIFHSNNPIKREKNFSLSNMFRYKSGEVFQEKRVLIVGFGNTGAELAIDLVWIFSLIIWGVVFIFFLICISLLMGHDPSGNTMLRSGSRFSFSVILFFQRYSIFEHLKWFGCFVVSWYEVQLISSFEMKWQKMLGYCQLYITFQLGYSFICAWIQIKVKIEWMFVQWDVM